MAARKAPSRRTEADRVVPPPAPWAAGRWGVWLAAAVVAGAGLLAYSNSFRGEYMFDDFAAVVDNRSIRHLWPPWRLLHTPEETSVSARPVLNLSFALNYAAAEALGQHPLDVRGYHAANLAIHLLAALTLLGALRRMLLAGPLRGRFGPSALPLALAGALLWALHPIHTACVSYITQRAESLMGLFYLLTVYCALRGMGGGGKGWSAAAVLACAAGMGSKEVMVSAPVLVLLIDRALVGGSFRRALRQRRGLYAALAGTWAVLIACLLSSTRGKSAGFGLGWTAWEYLRAQGGVLLHYLRLSFWPQGLVLDYFWPVPRSPWQWAPQGLVMLALLGVAAVGLWRNRPWALAGAAFFLILGPSSSVIPIVTEVAAEHRMYLPLAAIVALVLAAGFRLAEWALARQPADSAARQAAPLAGAGLILVLAAVLGGLTFLRNDDYRTGEAIWTDNVMKQPFNPRARCSLGVTCERYAAQMARAGDPRQARQLVEEARQQYQEALRIDPNQADALAHMGELLVKWDNRPNEALPYYQRLVRIHPESATAQLNRALILDQLGQKAQGLEFLEQTVRQFPGHADSQFALALMLFQRGRYAEAIPHYEQAVRLEPLAMTYRQQLAEAYARTGQFDRAIRTAREAIQAAEPQASAMRKALERQLALYRAGQTLPLPASAPQSTPASLPATGPSAGSLPVTATSSSAP